MSLALSVLFLDQTAVSVALPTIQRDLNINNTALQWVVNAYLLSTATILLLGGKLGDMISHRRLFIAGMLIFIIGSFTTAVVGDATWVIASRALQGIGAGFMIPSSSVVLFVSFPEHRRGRAMGIQVSLASIALSVGPIVGAYITTYLSWRYIFWLNLPIGLLSMGILCYCMTTEKDLQHTTNIDWLGFLLSLMSIVSLILALMQATDWGWLSTHTLGLLALSFISALLFYYYEQTHSNPLVNFDLFKNKLFVIGSVLLFLVQTNFVARIFVIIFLQNVLGYSVLSSGLLSLSTTLPVLFAGPISGYVQDKYGPRLPILIGSLMITLSSFYLASLVWLYNFWIIFPSLVLFSFGAPLVVTTARTIALSAVPADQYGASAGVCTTVRQIGSTFSMAVITSVILGLDQWYSSQYLNSIAPDLASKQSFTFGFSIAMFGVGLVGLTGVWLGIQLPKQPK